MNERFVAEPTTCDSAFELQHLLEKFGPVTGRYLAKFPASSWESLLRSHIEPWKDVERKKALLWLRRAMEARALISAGGSRYEDRDTWVRNVVRAQDSASRFDGVVVSRTNAGAFPSIDELELPPTSEERVAATWKEYARVSGVLLRDSTELHFIDPYFNPCNADRQVVLREMLRIAGAGRCQAAYVWLNGNYVKRSQTEMVWALRTIAIEAGFVSPRHSLYLRDFTDAGRDVKVHDRYLLSLYGSVRFEYGFQQLTGKKRADVSPVGSIRHLLLLEQFHEGKNDLGVESVLVDTQKPPSLTCSADTARRPRTAHS